MIKKLFFIAFIFFSVNVFATDYYVSKSGSNSNNGLTESKAWRTISYAAKKAKAGDIVWIKAGNYGNEKVVVKNNGKQGNPISFIGYKNNPGDISSMYYTYAKGKPLDPREMPMLDGGDRGKVARGIDLTSRSFITIKNIQVTNYSMLIKAGGNNNDLTLDNILAKTAGDFHASTQSGGLGYGFLFDSDKAYNNTIKNCIAINATLANFRVYGSNNIVENCKSISDEGTTTDNTGYHTSTDYYFIIRGSNNIVRNCYLERVGNLRHTGHGIAVKSVGIKTENNLIENCTIVNIKGALEARHDEVKHNTFRNILITVNKRSVTTYGTITIRDGASYNTFENIKVSGTNEGIRFYDQTEDGQGGTVASHNIIKNCIFNDIGTAIVATKDARVSKIGVVSNNSILNSTFSDVNLMYQGNLPMDNTNKLTNCNIIDVKGYNGKHSKYTPKWIETYNNYYNNGFTKPNGSGNISVDPQFIDAPNGDFRLKGGNNKSKCIDAGKDLQNVKTDYEGNKRPQGDRHDIGAFEYSDNTTGSINANAGSDVSICKGESTILEASGGTSYVWSTGETTASITVSPNERTTYNVTVSDGTDSDTDGVIVTINEAPTVNAGSDVSLCSGEAITLTANGIGDFLWSNGETTASITVSPTETTTYSVTASNSCSIEVTDDIIVTVTPGINLAINDDIEICTGETDIILTAESNGDYLWSTGETTPTITVSPTSTTTYTITSTLGDCSKTDEIVVTVNEAPTVNAGSDVSLCSGEAITLTANGTGDFLWSNGETTASITVSPTETTTYSATASNSCSIEVTDDIIVTVTPGINLTTTDDIVVCIGETDIILTADSNGDYLWSTGETTPTITVSPTSTTTYTITSTLGDCSKTDEIVVTVNEAPTVNAGSDVSLCSGEAITLTAKGIGDFLWSTGETTSSITVNPADTTTYSVTASNSCSNPVSDEVIVNVTPAITLDAGIDVTLCSGDSTTLTATSNGAILWSTGETSASIVVNPTTTTTYSVTSSSGECTLTDEVIVTINNFPSVSLGEDTKICLGENVTLTAVGTGNFLWSTGETTSSITVNPADTTTYSVTASTSCSDPVTDEIIVIVNELPTVDAGSDVIIAKGSSTVLTAIGEGNFLWSTGETTSSIVVDPTETTIYYVEVSNAGCSDTDSVKVSVSIEDATFRINDGLDITICIGEDVTLQTNGGINHLWDTGEITSGITVKPNHSTSYYVSALINDIVQTTEITINVNDCSGNKFNEFKVYPNPTTGLVNIFLPELRSRMSLKIISLSGKVVYDKEMKGDSNGIFTQVDLSTMAKGIYILRIYYEDFNETKKVLLI